MMAAGVVVAQEQQGQQAQPAGMVEAQEQQVVVISLAERRVVEVTKSWQT